MSYVDKLRSQLNSLIGHVTRLAGLVHLLGRYSSSITSCYHPSWAQSPEPLTLGFLIIIRGHPFFPGEEVQITSSSCLVARGAWGLSFCPSLLPSLPRRPIGAGVSAVSDCSGYLLRQPPIHLLEIHGLAPSPALG